MRAWRVCLVASIFFYRWLAWRRCVLAARVPAGIVPRARGTRFGGLSGPRTGTRAARQRRLCFPQIMAAPGVHGARGAGVLQWGRRICAARSLAHGLSALVCRPLFAWVGTRLFVHACKTRWTPRVFQNMMKSEKGAWKTFKKGERGYILRR